MAIYARDNFRCVYCFASRDDDVMTLDHLDGDDNAPSNLVTCCATCNASRGTTPLEVWSAIYALRARHQAAIPIDPARGRELARERWPSWRGFRPRRGHAA